MSESMRKYARRSGLILILFAAALTLAACGSNKSMRGAGTPTAVMQGTGPAADAGVDQGRGIRGRNINVSWLQGIPPEDRAKFMDPSSPLSVHTIYFGFDSAAIPPRFAPVIEAHAEYLAKHPNVHLRLGGHTDERGTREYNVALGQRRAEAVKRALVLSGAPANQITTLSFGEERPAVIGHTLEAYAKNRRVELVYVE